MTTDDTTAGTSKPAPIEVNQGPPPASSDLVDIELGDNGHHHPNLHKQMQVCARSIELEFRDIAFSVQIKGKKPDKHKKDASKGDSEGLTGAGTTTRHILKGISGRAKPGKLIAIIGASGAGKTSLLNILSSRQVEGNAATKVTGDILINGEKVDSKNLKRHAAYIMQEDILMPTLTVRESLQFSAQLRLPNSMSQEDKNARVNQLISELSLDACADTRVGDNRFIRGISGGEKKRACIGTELITNPSLLFVDEPTSGLDSFTAFQVIDLLKNLALSGRTVISTIHQPSSDILALFDELWLLTQGKCIYQGPVQGAVDHFAGLGHQCPQFSNPADFFMNLMTVRNQADQQVVDQLIAEAPPIAKSDSNHDQKEPLSPGLASDGNTNSLGKEITILTRRAFTNIKRNPVMSKVRFGQTVFMSLIMMALYWQMDENQSGVRNRQGALFFFTVANIMNSVMSTVLSFPAERALFMKEKQNSMYSTGAYFWGKSIAEVPFQLFFPTLFSVMIYWSMGLNPSFTSFLSLCGITILVSNAAQSMGLCLGCAVADAEAAVSLAPVVIIPFMLFGGFFVETSQIPVWLRWVQWLSIFKYGFGALAINEFAGETFGCSASEYITAPGAGQVCPITSGDQVLEVLDLQESDLGWFCGLLVVLMVAIRLLAFAILKRKASQ